MPVRKQHFQIEYLQSKSFFCYWFCAKESYNIITEGRGWKRMILFFSFFSEQNNIAKDWHKVHFVEESSYNTIQIL